jgi:hypothetical protein
VGPLVTNTTPALTIAMAGRQPTCDDLTSPGVPVLRERGLARLNQTPGSTPSPTPLPRRLTPVEYETLNLAAPAA